jgi:cytosine/uracil/thiamine/allantoin permease
MYTANAETLSFLIFMILLIVISFLILKKIKNLTTKIVTLFIVIVLSFFVWTFGRTPIINIVNSILTKTNFTTTDMFDDFMPSKDLIQDYQNSKNY